MDFDADRPPGISRDLAVWLHGLATRPADVLHRLVAADWFGEQGDAPTEAALRHGPLSVEHLRALARSKAMAAVAGPAEAEWENRAFMLARCEVERFDQLLDGMRRVALPNQRPLPPLVFVPHHCPGHRTDLSPAAVELRLQRAAYSNSSPETGRRITITVQYATGSCRWCGDQYATELTPPEWGLVLDESAEDYIRRLIPDRPPAR